MTSYQLPVINGKAHTRRGRMQSGMMKGTLASIVAALAVLSGTAAAADWMPGAVELSDGRRIEGRVHIVDDRLIIHNEAQARRITVRAAAIARLDTSIERQSMAEKWIFRESGLDDKVYTGEVYPVRHYTTRITFHEGKPLIGSIVPKTVYVESGGKRQRFILRKKDEGKVGQGLDELLYVTSIIFNRDAAGARGPIEGTLKPPFGEPLQKVLAINRDNLFSVEATFSPFEGTFRASDCTEGTYDLVVVTDKAVYLHFSRERDAGAGRLDTAQVADIEAWIAKLRDFFHEQRIVYGAGNEERAFVLVRKERHGGTTLEGAALIRRYDVWAMHKPSVQWQIEKRMFVLRLVSEKALVTPRKVVIVPGLSGHRISAESPGVKVNVELAPNREVPIPDPPIDEPEAPNGD